MGDGWVFLLVARRLELSDRRPNDEATFMPVPSVIGKAKTPCGQASRCLCLALYKPTCAVNDCTFQVTSGIKRHGKLGPRAWCYGYNARALESTCLARFRDDGRY